MAYSPIEKRGNWDVVPNLLDYDQAWAEFSWDDAKAGLDGLPGGRLNIAHEAVDRHAQGGLAGRDAIRWLGKQGTSEHYSYAELRRSTNRFASGLDALGVPKGARVFILSGRIPALYIAALGTLKYGCVMAPLFSAFGPEPIKQRINIGDGTVLVTTAALSAAKVADIRAEMPSLRHVVVVGGAELDDDVLDFDDFMAAGSDDFEVAPTSPEDMALLHFTSGTTGQPKGAIHVHAAVAHHLHTGRVALDFHPEDVFWCTADPGWVTGTSYGIIAPLVHGLTMIVDEGEFDPDRWYGVLQDQGVTVWYTAPTAVRMLMRAGSSVAKEYDLSRLRFVASVGEPLHPDGVIWGQEAFGLPIHDNWWQTETGGIMIANYAGSTVLPGSMGRPLPGITAGILRRDQHGKVMLDEAGAAVQASRGEEGELAIRPGWPSMFRGYLHREERYAQAFQGGWYCTGDLAKCDAEGFFWFVGRADDAIKTSGHLIGPFEVESVLLSHPAVAEAGVIGVPDEAAGEIVKAFVSLNPGFEAGKALVRELKAHARLELGPAVAPRQIEVRDHLPETRSGKIMRRLLRAQELGLPTGDLSTLAQPEAQS